MRNHIQIYSLKTICDTCYHIKNFHFFFFFKPSLRKLKKGKQEKYQNLF